MRYYKKKFAKKRGIKRERKGEKKRKERKRHKGRGKQSLMFLLLLSIYFEKNTYLYLPSTRLNTPKNGPKTFHLKPLYVVIFKENEV